VDEGGRKGREAQCKVRMSFRKAAVLALSKAEESVSGGQQMGQGRGKW
jgi:hypothetical protein